MTQDFFNLVRRYLKTFEIPSSYPGDKSDLFQVGMIGVLKALDTHDPSKSKIKTWAWYWIRSEVRAEVTRKSKPVIGHEDDVFIIKDKVLLKQLISMIKISKDREVVIRYLSGQQTNEISKEWGVSRQCVEQRLARAIKDIRRKVNAKPILGRRRLCKGSGILLKANAKDQLDSAITH